MDKRLLPDSQVTPELFETLCSNIQSAVAHRFNQNIEKGNLREFAARVLGFEDYNRAAPVLKADKQNTDSFWGGFNILEIRQRERARAIRSRSNQKRAWPRAPRRTRSYGTSTT